jgi:TusA-related sulfurtransferase
MSEQVCDQVLDITGETCPMTYVRTRLALDRLAPGQVLAVRLSGAEPERNVPRNAVQQGHAVLATERDPSGVTTVYLRRG